MEIYGTKSEKIMHRIWLTLPLLIIITDIVLAIVTKEWFVLIGIPLVMLGFSTSSPYNKIKNTISGIAGIMFIASFFLLAWHWSVIIGSLLFSQIFLMTARESYSIAITERALQSEIFFCWMFFNNIILVKDNKTNQLIQSTQ